MRALVDTNILVRHLTGDPPGQARRATAFLRRRHELILADLIVAELVYVLESFYDRSRAEIAASIRATLMFPSMFVADLDVLLRAIELYEQARLDFADAYLVAVGELSNVRRIVSFDRQLDRAEGFVRVEP